jgi:predicted nuclease of predicted toxin-antitoxin system
MKRKRVPYLKEKFKLYFDGNIPNNVIELLKQDRKWQKKCKIFCSYDEELLNKEDIIHFDYCKKNDLILVTLDKGFMDDNKYPFTNLPGIIRIIARKNDSETILANLMSLLTFLSFFPLSRSFMYDTKIEVRSNGCLIRGRDSMTREIKTLNI